MQVDNFKWELGTEPRGWREGDRIRLAADALPGFFKLIRAQTLTDVLAALSDDDAPTVFAVPFHNGARIRVLHWLRKFANSEDYVTISKHII